MALSVFHFKWNQQLWRGKVMVCLQRVNVVGTWMQVLPFPLLWSLDAIGLPWEQLFHCPRLYATLHEEKNRQTAKVLFHSTFFLGRSHTSDNCSEHREANDTLSCNLLGRSEQLCVFQLEQLKTMHYQMSNPL